MRQLTKLEQRYYEQVEVVSNMWQILYQMADVWISTENYDALRDQQVECEQQEEKQRVLYRQAYCKHENAHDSDTSCPDCDLKFNQFTV